MVFYGISRKDFQNNFSYLHVLLSLVRSLIDSFMGGFRGGLSGGHGAPLFRFVKNFCYQLPFEWSDVVLSPRNFWPPLSEFSGSTLVSIGF